MRAPQAFRVLARRVAPGLMADRDRRYERSYREAAGATTLATAIAESDVPFVVVMAAGT